MLKYNPAPQTHSATRIYTYPYGRLAARGDLVLGEVLHRDVLQKLLLIHDRLVVCKHTAALYQGILILLGTVSLTFS